MTSGRSRSRGGIYAAAAAIAITAGLGAVGAAGADESANADIYARGEAADSSCFSDDPAATDCAAGGTAEVTINVGETVTFHFQGTLQHNAVGDSPVPWKVPDTGYAQPGSQHTETFTQPGDYAFVCALHPMTGTIKVVGPAPTQTPTPTPPSSPPPTGETTTPPPTGGAADSVKPTVRSLRTKALRRAVRVQFKLSEPATVTVRVKRRGSRRVLKSTTVQAAAGTRSVTLRSKSLKKGRYTVEIQARDASGNRSSLAKKQLSLRG